MNGPFAPARTPAAVINRLNSELRKSFNNAEVKERFLRSGYELVISTPEQSTASINAEMTKMGKVIQEAGIRAE